MKVLTLELSEQVTVVFAVYFSKSKLNLVIPIVMELNTTALPGGIIEDEIKFVQSLQPPEN